MYVQIYLYNDKIFDTSSFCTLEWLNCCHFKWITFVKYFSNINRMMINQYCLFWRLTFLHICPFGSDAELFEWLLYCGLLSNYITYIADRYVFSSWFTLSTQWPMDTHTIFLHNYFWRVPFVFSYFNALRIQRWLYK